MPTATRQRVTLTPEEVGIVMLAEGFPADAGTIATGIGVCTAESGRRRTARNAGGDRGPWQINNRYHGEVSDACAFEWVCSTRAAASISNHGSDWSPWTTYAAGIGLPYRFAAARAIRRVRALEAGHTRLAGLHLPNPLGIPEPPNILDLIPGLGSGGGGGLPSNPGGALGDAGHAVASGIPDAINAVASVLEKIAQFFAGLGELLLTPAGWARLAKIIGGALAVAFGMNILIRETTGVDLGKGAARAAAAAAIIH